MTSATEKLRVMLDERGIEYRADDGTTVWATHWKFGEHSSAMFTEYDDGECVFVTSGHAWTPEQAIAATLGDDDYETRMDLLLSRLTNGMWSKSRSYSVDFMASCVDEAYEQAYAKDATLREHDGTRWHELFGSPERAARTLARMCQGIKTCATCPLFGAGLNHCKNDCRDFASIERWLRGESDGE